MRRQLSSRQTFLAKFVIPAVAFVAAAALFVTPFFVMPLLGEEPFAWGPALIALCCVGLTAWWCLTTYVPLKVVSVERPNLWVSNYVKEVAVPLSEVKQVAEVEQFKQKLIVLSLKRPTEFGREIKFLPRAELRLLKEHSVVHELRVMAKAQEMVQALLDEVSDDQAADPPDHSPGPTP